MSAPNCRPTRRVDDVALRLRHPLDFEVVLQLGDVVAPGMHGISTGVLAGPRPPPRRRRLHLQQVLGRAHQLADDTPPCVGAGHGVDRSAELTVVLSHSTVDDEAVASALLPRI